VPVQNALFITFVLSAWIRELGFRASVESHWETAALAAQAGLGRLNTEGRLVTPQFGTKVYIADAICTDLPLIADG
jgi:epoxyqueuosine reductase QueG